MHDKAEAASRLALLEAPPLAFELAEPGRPGEGEHVEIERAGRPAASLAGSLRRRWGSRKQKKSEHAQRNFLLEGEGGRRMPTE